MMPDRPNVLRKIATNVVIQYRAKLVHKGNILQIGTMGKLNTIGFDQGRFYRGITLSGDFRTFEERIEKQHN